MSWSLGRVAAFDLETTSLEMTTVRPVQFGWAEFDNRQKVRSRHGLVNCEMPIPEASTAIHGITDEMAKANGGNYTRTLAGILDLLLETSVQHVPLIAYNGSFDLMVIDNRLRDIDGKGLRDHGWDGVLIDPLVIDRACDKYRKGSRKLSAVCAHYGVDHRDAHSAMGDVLATVELAFALADKYPEVANATPEELLILQRGWRREQIAHLSEYFVSQGNPPIPEFEQRFPLWTDEVLSAP